MNYEMTEDDLKTLLSLMQPAPMLNVGRGPSRQESANHAWRSLGMKMGFDHRTVKPTGKGDRFFTAIPSETELLRKERIEREWEAAYNQRFLKGYKWKR